MQVFSAPNQTIHGGSSLGEAQMQGKQLKRKGANKTQRAQIELTLKNSQKIHNDPQEKGKDECADKRRKIWLP